jgi:hypothetical protein
MKLKSLFLGSVAAAGLSTAGFAADLGVLTSLDVCDSLGISGLTISSSDNCLALSGGVTYEFGYGDWDWERPVARTFDGNRNVIAGRAYVDPVTGEEHRADWESKVEAWLKAVGTASSDFGPASATIKLKSVERYQTWNDGYTFRDGTAIPGGPATLVHGDTQPFEIDEAFVQVGDTTTIMAGKKGSIANLGDDAPFNFLGLFNSDAIDGKGVGIDADYDGLGGHVIQVVSNLGNGLSVGVGLENLDDGLGAPATAGTLVGVVSYAGEGITAHLTAAAFGVLDGDVESWAIHAGATGTFDAFKIRGAVSYWDNFKFRTDDILNALVSVEGTFDLFTLAASAEVANVTNSAFGDYTDYGFGASAGFAVTEGVSINLGARYFQDGLNDLDTTQVAAQVVAAVTETVKATGEIGAYFGDAITAEFGNDSVIYGSAELAWAPGGGFTSSLRGEVNSEEAYKVTFKAAKEFK